MSRGDIRAAVFDGPGRPFHVERCARPALHPNEALVRVSLCTVCGSDLHTFTGRRRERTPCVLGHEPVGVVEEVNGDLRDVTGDPVRVAVRPGGRAVHALPLAEGHGGGEGAGGPAGRGLAADKATAGN